MRVEREARTGMQAPGRKRAMLAIALTLLLLLALGACGAGSKDTGAPAAGGANGTDTDGREAPAAEGAGGTENGSGEAPQGTADGGGNEAPEKNTPNATQKLSAGDVLTIPVAGLTEQATFFPVEVDGTSLEIFALKAPDGTIRTAFNTCQVCYGSGRGYYIQEKDELVCQNCGNRFKASDVEVVRGGCNPVPITPENKLENSKTITIAYEFIAQAIPVFSNWRP